MSATTTIYIQLLGEAVDVWAAAQAEPIGNGAFRIIGFAENDDDDAGPQFHIGDVVQTENKMLSEGACLVAVRRAA